MATSIRINVPLTQEQARALFILAERESRQPRQQASVIIREALERCGLLPVKAAEPCLQGAPNEHPA
jgi:hypothetical protein